MSARIFNIGDPVRIITERRLRAFLRGNVRQRRPGVHLRPASYCGAQGLVVAVQYRSVALESPPTGYDVAFTAPADLPVSWFPNGVPQPARLVVHGLRSAELQFDPSADPLVLMRPWRHLSSAMAALFGVHPEIRVVVDRRYGKRRQKSCPVREERRWVGERRGSLPVETEAG